MKCNSVVNILTLNTLTFNILNNNTNIFTLPHIRYGVYGEGVYNLTMGNIYYKGMKLGAFGLPVYLTENSKAKKANRKRKFYYLTFNSPFKDSSPKNLIVMYDIPDDKKKERDWFRRQLKHFGYIMIQRSVWVGPSPLPKEFRDYVKLIGLVDKIKTLKLAKAYQEKGLY